MNDLSSSMPTAHTRVSENDVSIKMKVPGLTIDDVDVQVDENVVSIRGQKVRKKGEDENLKVVEESFQQVIQLPCAVNGDRTKATVKDGLLTIMMPRAGINVSGKTESEWQ